MLLVRVSLPELTLTHTNVGDVPISFGSGTARGTILDDDGRVVGASDHLGLPAVGIGVELEPGESSELPLAVTTASWDPALGYTSRRASTS